MNDLTVVIASCNEHPPTLAQTVQTIRETSSAQVVVVDDCSNTPVSAMIKQDSGVRVVTNFHRVGCGPSRHIGILSAMTEYVAIFDSHMIPVAGWYENALKRLRDYPHAILCGKCIGLDREHPIPDKSTSFYYGGTLNVCGPDRQDSKKTQVAEVIWNPPGIKDDQEIACVLGACYFMHRDWYLHLNALKYLREIGCDELMLSVKSWCMGGSCRFMENIQIGHRFLSKGERQGFKVSPGVTLYNKLFAIHTLFPPIMVAKLIGELRRTTDSKEFALAEKMIKDNWGIVACEKTQNAANFRFPFISYAQKFGLNSI